jgi:hypothetical protein
MLNLIRSRVGAIFTSVDRRRNDDGRCSWILFAR